MLILGLEAISKTLRVAGSALGRRWLRCSSVEYRQYSRSSRLASRAQMARPARSGIFEMASSTASMVE